MSSIAKLGYYNAEIVGKLVERAGSQISFYMPAELSSLIWALGKMGVAPGEAPATHTMNTRNHSSSEPHPFSVHHVQSKRQPAIPHTVFKIKRAHKARA